MLIADVGSQTFEVLNAACKADDQQPVESAACHYLLLVVSARFDI